MQRIVDGKVEDVDMSGTELKANGDTLFNPRVKMIDKLVCYVPVEVSQAMRTLNHLYRGVEFSIFGVFKYNEKDRTVHIQETYYIPEQRVTQTSVNYLEQPPDDHNLVIHKHPRGCMQFSGTDDTYINQNFDMSILYVNNQFHLGHIRAKTKYGLVAIPLILRVEEEYITIPKVFQGKIHRVGANVNRNVTVQSAREEQEILNETFGLPFGDY